MISASKNLKWEIHAKFASRKNNSTEDLVKIILENRGFKSLKERREFLSPDLNTITASSVGIDAVELNRATKRVNAAIEKQEQIVIFGDYDVDGVTGSAILWETLHGINAKVMPYIPDRMTEGYGLSIKALDNLLKNLPDTKLIITVDNGIVAEEAVTYASSKGIDVIVTDHHLPEKKIKTVKNAYATIHTTSLCGAGVAYVFSQEFKGTKMGDKNDNHLELAALGTFADMMPLVDANRVVAFYGIEKIKTSKRPGLLALFEEAGIDKENISEYTVGHIIVPRLNSTGRLNSAMDSLRLLCTRNNSRAKELAVDIGKTNKQRQEILLSSSIKAVGNVRSIEDEKRIIVVSDEEYQEGVIGLIAGRLVEEFYRPAIVISKKEGQSKASVRSVSGFNIIEFLRIHKEYFLNVGGHPMAAGFTVKTESIEDLTVLLEESARDYVKEEMLLRKLKIDLEIDFDLVTVELYEAMSGLEPFGMGNPRPVFLSRGVEVKSVRFMGKESNHLKFTLGGMSIDAVGFGMSEKGKHIKEGNYLDVVYSVDENLWNGRRKLQLKLKDFKISSTS